MKKITLFLTCTCISLLFVSAQTVGSFQKTITFNSNNHSLEYYVPNDYDSNESYPLIVALHGCGGDAISFRNSLIEISDSLNAIILCPDFMGDQISGTNGQIIPNSIDTTIIDLGYNIDTTSVFLTGFSCNGQETFKHGLNAIYPFAGIIPFNSWIPSITNDYNYDSKVPTCICSGDQDASYPNNVTLFNNLTANEAIVKLNTLIGINHVWSYNNTTEELLECFDWIKSLDQTVATIFDQENKNNIFTIFPNPTSDKLSVTNFQEKEVEIGIYNLEGKTVFKKTSSKKDISINTSEYSNGTYFIKIRTDQENSWTDKFIIQK
ncbi:MAG: T9SS type A sorting domain-containing protein [Flavobacteriales bacterium]|jgi:predicted esterase|tara:strand:+ start:8415 stop:9380 length:966 start_codon:yes stop_codon:yes gene_type:complete